MKNQKENLIEKRMQADAKLLKDGLQIDVQDKVVSFIHLQQKTKYNSKTAVRGWDTLRQWLVPIGLLAILVIMAGLNFVKFNEDIQENPSNQIVQVIEINNNTDKLVAINGDSIQLEKQGLKNDLIYLSRIFTL